MMRPDSALLAYVDACPNWSHRENATEFVMVKTKAITRVSELECAHVERRTTLGGQSREAVWFSESDATYQSD